MARITVEDCLKKVDNRFSLTHIAAQRAKQILEGSPAIVDTKGNRSIVSALREIASGKVRWMTEADLEKEAQELALQREARLAASAASQVSEKSAAMQAADAQFAHATAVTEMEQIITEQVKLNGENGVEG